MPVGEILAGKRVFFQAFLGLSGAGRGGWEKSRIAPVRETFADLPNSPPGLEDPPLLPEQFDDSPEAKRMPSPAFGVEQRVCRPFWHSCGSCNVVKIPQLEPDKPWVLLL
jgi:hypothetical protein